jgi:hypothetical protein
MTTGSLVVVVGMMLVSNRSNRRERLLLIIFVVFASLIYSTSGCHLSRAFNRKFSR